MMNMESTINNLGMSAKFNLIGESLEIVVIEDNKLSNMLLSQTFDSMIKRIRSLKNFPLKFSSFKSTSNFLNYLESNEFEGTKLMVFTDQNLEKVAQGPEVLDTLEKKEIDVTMIAMSGSEKTRQSREQAKKTGDFLPKKNKKSLAYS